MSSLPNVKWITVDELASQTSYSYQEVLIVTNKHGVRDWMIVFGWIEPTDNYTSFKLMSKPAGLSVHYPDVEIPLRDVIMIGTIRNYGNVFEEC